MGMSGNGEISMNPSYQCRLSNCNFNVKFGNLNSSNISAENVSIILPGFPWYQGYFYYFRHEVAIVSAKPRSKSWRVEYKKRLYAV